MVAGIIPGSRSSTDHCQFDGPFFEPYVDRPGCFATPLCSGIGGGTHLDSRYQGGVIVRAIMPHTIDEKGRWAIDAAAHAADKIVAYLVSELAGLERIAQRCFGKHELW